MSNLSNVYNNHVIYTIIWYFHFILKVKRQIILTLLASLACFQLHSVRQSFYLRIWPIPFVFDKAKTKEEPIISTSVYPSLVSTNLVAEQSLLLESHVKNDYSKSVEIPLTKDSTIVIMKEPPLLVDNGLNLIAAPTDPVYKHPAIVKRFWCIPLSYVKGKNLISIFFSSVMQCRHNLEMKIFRCLETGNNLKY